MFKKRLDERLAVLEAVLDALLGLLAKKDVVSHHEMQIELLRKADEDDSND